MFQQLRISLADAEARLRRPAPSLRATAQYAQLKSQAQLVPQIEQEFTELNRDYEIQKSTYARACWRAEKRQVWAWSAGLWRPSVSSDRPTPGVA